MLSINRHLLNCFSMVCCCLAFIGCDTVFDVHPYDVNIRGEKNINAKRIALIEKATFNKDTIRLAFISDSHKHYNDLNDIIRDINRRDTIDFVVHGGDVTDCGTTRSYHLLPYMLDPFDFNEFKKNPMKFYAVCTDIERGCSVYHEIDDANGIGMRWMQASASMPVFAKPVEIDGRYYLDGGITDSIPLKFIQEKGFKKNIVILTQPADFRKKKAHVGLIMKLLLNRYPMVAELMARRYVMYNNELDYIHSELKKGDTFLICPDEKLDIGRLSMKEDKILRVYEAGVEKAQQLLPQIKDFISIKSKLVY